VRADVLISNKVDIRTTNSSRDKEGCNRDDRAIYKEDNINLNVHTPNNKASKYKRQKRILGEIESTYLQMNLFLYVTV
jgi:hypothetical protein